MNMCFVHSLVLRTQYVYICVAPLSLLHFLHICCTKEPSLMRLGYSPSSSSTCCRLVSALPTSLPSSFTTVHKYPQKSISISAAVNVTRFASNPKPDRLLDGRDWPVEECEWNRYIQTTSADEPRTCSPDSVNHRDCAVSKVCSSSANLDEDFASDAFPLLDVEAGSKVKSPAKRNTIPAYSTSTIANSAQSSLWAPTLAVPCPVIKLLSRLLVLIR